MYVICISRLMLVGTRDKSEMAGRVLRMESMRNAFKNFLGETRIKL
jgi:hypothetical protein